MVAALSAEVVTPYHSVIVISCVVVHVVADSLAEPCHVTPVTAGRELTVIDVLDLNVTTHTIRTSPLEAVTAPTVKEVPVVQAPVSVVPSIEGDVAAWTSGSRGIRATKDVRSSHATSIAAFGRLLLLRLLKK